MELKKFQQKVIGDLKEYLDILNRKHRVDIAFSEFWANKGVNVGFGGLPLYKNNIKNVPHVCFKVPTGGGKTFLACNAIKPIFDAMPFTKTKAVVWLVPSNTILEQTILNLKNPEHPYRQKINVDFSHRVEIYTKEELLNAQSFSPTAVNEQLSILILSFDTFRSKKKEDRKIYQENGNLREFVKHFNDPNSLIADIDETALIQVINQLNPVIIVDESHNAETELSIEMLNNLNPSFVLDLTATPRKNSNIISYVDSMQLKIENMVKLPVVVYNHHKMEDVILDAIQLRKNIEAMAVKEQKLTGNYIRPIVLFQAQPKGKEENETFEKLREKLIDIGIPKEEIAIKTSIKNELKNIDLKDSNCPIRYIITVNALKEGWDCPFAYILATLANRSSSVDVEQILGRILRQPYTTRHKESLLNLSYVFTCSETFRETLDNIVAGLNRAGFSKKDFRLAGEAEQNDETQEQKKPGTMEQISIDDMTVKTSSDEDKLTTDENTEEFLAFNTEHIKVEIEKSEEETSAGKTEGSNLIIEVANKEEQAFNLKVETYMNENSADAVSEELKDKMNIFKINEIYKESAKDIKIPQFFIKIQRGFLTDGDLALLAKENLSEEFTLKDKDTKISFETAEADIYTIDLEKQSDDESVPKYLKMSKNDVKYINEYISRLPDAEKIKSFREILLKQLGKIDSIEEKELKDYIEKVLKNLTSEQISDMENAPYKYANAIKKKVLSLQEEFMEEEFYKQVDTGKIICKESYAFKPEISPSSTLSSIAKSLYEAEQDINNFEHKVITDIASLSNIKFWHRNIDRRGFCINGFTNHYPDFITMTQGGKIIMLETKGDFLKNDENLKKLKLGRKWQELAGGNYRYFMVFQNKNINIDGAYNHDEFMNIIRNID